MSYLSDYTAAFLLSRSTPPLVPQYPILLVPASIDKTIFAKRVPYPPIKPETPIEPTRPPFRLYNELKGEGALIFPVGLLSIGIIAIILGNFTVKESGLLLLVYMFFSLIYLLIKSVPYLIERPSYMNLYRTKLISYISERNAFPSKLNKYECSMIEHKEALIKHDNILKGGYIESNYVKAELLDTKITFLKDANTQPVIGRCEHLLFDALSVRFGSSVRRDICIPRTNKMSTNEYTLRPDITMHHSESRCTIAIEIDEPYVLSSGEPIHYIDADDERNSAFIALGWIVIRFTERQVVQNIDECVSLIEDITLNLWGSTKKLINPLTVVDHAFQKSKRDSLWTQEEARSMAFNNYRLSYYS